MPQVAINQPSSGAPENPDQRAKMVAAMHGAVGHLLKTGGAMLDADEDGIPPRCNFERKEYNEVLRETDVCSVPDVHGDLGALRNSLISMGLIDPQTHKWIGGKRVVQLLGDYMDRGERNIEVLRELISLKKQAEAAGGQVKFLVGNHETMMLGAIADLSGYRENWQRLENGGDATFEEMQFEYGLDGHRTDDEVWQRMWGEFLEPGGEFTELYKSMDLVSQVDDVLYVHGGINVHWARLLASKGVDGLNRIWREALADFKIGRKQKFVDLMEEDSPLWLRYGEHMKALKDSEVAEISENLKKIGINAVVLGHDITDTGPEMYDEFEKHGIKLIASDVGMTGEGKTEQSGIGGVKIDEKGNIEGRSRHGVKMLYSSQSQA